MGQLPVISGQEAVGAFGRAGWIVLRRSKKNHFILKKEGSKNHLSIPDHSTLDRGLLRSLIRDAELTIETFIALL